MTSCLVLEGGAMRSMFTAGVLDSWLDHQLSFTAGVGVSAGAAFGVNYKSRQKGRVLRYNLRFAGKPYYASWRSWRRSGNLYARDFCYHIIPDRLDPFDKKTFQANPMQFWSVATDAETGQANYHLLKDAGYADLEWIRASASIPFFAHPVAIGGHFYFDGGVSDSIPLHFAQKRYDRVVLLLTQPADYRKGKDHLWPIEKTVLHKYPAILAKIKTRSHDYNACLNEIARLEKAGKIVVIRPKKALDIGTLESDRDQLKRVYELGLTAGEESYQFVREFVK